MKSVLKLLMLFATSSFSPISCDEEIIKWGPSVSYENGEYWGQSALDVTSGTQVPHGTGTYISKQGQLLYDGKWWKGYMHGSGKRFFSVSYWYQIKVFLLVRLIEFAISKNCEGFICLNFVGNYKSFQDGRNYSGFLEYNTLHGNGTLAYPNGTIFRGNFYNGVPSGEGGDY